MKPTTLKDTTETGEQPTAMEALDAGLLTAGDPEAMPPGFTQTPLPQDTEDDDANAWSKFVRTNYSWCALGILLSPLAFLVRVGRWSMRTLWQHHVGGEFGGF